MGLGLLLMILFVLFLVGALPRWPHSRTWGYYPSGMITVVLALIVILILTGHM